ncbi:MAG TPA: NUDIX domain-containing protein [Candidatus Scatomorpha stercorigallinarum]|nr:NUDIX domain-containing protein [Candidatus Scatomorpha stercorigallinarum]
MSESILVVRREYLAPYLTEDFGLITEGVEEIVRVIEAHHEFRPRPEMETDPAYKQIIPYVLVTRGAEAFVMQRLKRGGEQRLHGLLSLGVGGHINPVDDTAGHGALMAGLRREVDEEVAVERAASLTPLGVINNDRDEVGRVHLGFLFRLEAEGAVTVRETEKLSGSFMPIAALPALRDKMEGWSQIALEVLA